MGDDAETPARPATLELDWRAALRPGAAALLAGLVVASSVIPWYARQIGPVDAAPSIAGLDAGSFALIAIALASFVIVASAALALDAAGAFVIEPPIALVLTWAALGAALAATALVTYKLLFIPEPSQFFTRDIGLWLAFLGSAGAGSVLVFEIPTRMTSTRR